MSLSIQSFRGLQGDRLFLTDNQQGQDPAVRSVNLSFLQKLKALPSGGRLSLDGGTDRAQAYEFKQGFLNALAQSEGHAVATEAMKLADTAGRSLPSGPPMSGADVRKVLDKAQELRRGNIEQTGTKLAAFMRDTGPDSLVAALQQHVPGASDVPMRELQKMFWNAVRSDSRFSRNELKQENLKQVASDTVTKFVQDKQGRFDEAHPGLATISAQILLSDAKLRPGGVFEVLSNQPRLCPYHGAERLSAALESGGLPPLQSIRLLAC